MLSAQSEFSYLAKVEQVTKLYYDAYVQATPESVSKQNAHAHMITATLAAQKKFASQCGLAHIPTANYESCFNNDFNPSYFMASSVNMLRARAGSMAYDTHRDRIALDTLKHVPFPFMYCGLRYEYICTESSLYTGFAVYGFVQANIDFVPQDHLVLIPLEAFAIHEYPAVNN